MHEYLDAPISKLMRRIKSDCPHLDLYTASKMLEMCGIEPIPGGAAFAGRSLVLGTGLSPFANALGSRDFGHEVIGICFHASNLHQQNWWKSRSRSRARFTYSTIGDLNLTMPLGNWDNVFVLPNVNWPDISNFVLSKMREDCKIVVAQKMPIKFELGDWERIFVRTTQREYCHKTENMEDAEFVIVQIR